MRGDGPIAGRRSSHVIPVMPRRAGLPALGAGRTPESGKFCAHEGLQSRTPSLKRENGAEFGPVSRWVVLRVCVLTVQSVTRRQRCTVRHGHMHGTAA